MIGNVGSTGMQAWSGQVSGQQKPPPAPDFAQMFSAIDGDGDGALTETELLSAVQSSDGSADVSALLSSLDADGDGSVAQSEFTTAMENVLGQLQAQAGMGGMPPPPPPGDSDPFASMDADGDGSITSAELSSATAARAEATGRSGPSAEQMMAELDTDGDGALSQTEMAAGAEARRGSPPPPEGGADLDSQRIASVLRHYVENASFSTAATSSTLIASA